MNMPEEGTGEGASLDPSVIAALARLKTIDMEIDSMRRSLDRRPKEIDFKRRELAKQEAAMKTAIDTVKAAQRRIDKKTLESDALAADVKKLDGQLFSLKSNDEFNAMKSQIANRKAKDDVLQTEILELMEAIETLKAEHAAELQKVEAAKASLKKVEDRSDVEMSEAQAELDKQVQRRQDLIDGLPTDVGKLYLATVERREHAIAFLLDQICKGCDTQVTANIMGAVMGAKLTRCPHCQRLLIIEH